jgi:hypothetical protein
MRVLVPHGPPRFGASCVGIHPAANEITLDHLAMKYHFAHQVGVMGRQSQPVGKPANEAHDLRSSAESQDQSNGGDNALELGSSDVSCLRPADVGV